MYRHWPSAKSVSNASDDLPEPDTPVTTVSLSWGISSEMFLRLFWRAPWIRSPEGWAIRTVLLRWVVYWNPRHDARARPRLTRARRPGTLRSLLLIMITKSVDPHETLRARGLRLTKPRRLILDVVRATDVHPTAAFVYRRVRRRLPRVSLATVYRNLRVLAAEGLLAERTDAAGLRFDGNAEPHDHFTCVGGARCAPGWRRRPGSRSSITGPSTSAAAAIAAGRAADLPRSDKGGAETW